MLFTTAFVASVAGLAAAAPSRKVATRAFGDTYTFYTGDGTLAAGWPNTDAWGTYTQLWNANEPLMRQSCGWNSYGGNDGPIETGNINTSIQNIAASTGVDPRFILAIIMQESGGCVRVPTTFSPDKTVRNPGLMQSHNGTGTCHEGSKPTVPCPQSEIFQMIEDGTAGTPYGDGLEQTHAKAIAVVGDHPRAWYGAARIYNSGSVNWKNMNDGLGATNCYVSDVANRLMGWTLAKNTCTA